MSYTITLAGHPNSGKTTTFNQLVGGREKVGNWPGTTVERKEGRFSFQGRDIHVVDLPGIYSLSFNSLDEKIASQYLSQSRPDVVITIIDASHLERNLYLVAQLLEMGQKVIVGLNMMDIAREHQIQIHAQDLGRLLHVPVVELIAHKGAGISQLKEQILKVLEGQQAPSFLRIDYTPCEEDIQRLERFLLELNLAEQGRARLMAIKILEGDEEFLRVLKKEACFPALLNIRQEIEKRQGKDLEELIRERRYAFVKGVTRECASRQMTLEQRLTLSDQIDMVVTNQFWGIPIFLFLMYLLFSGVFRIGGPVVNFIDYLFSSAGGQISAVITARGWPLWLASLLEDGVISGVGSVISFVPYIALLFMGISILEDSGYLARAAFIMDRAMHALGLHGKSFIPMLIGFGCNVPGILATRTLNSEKDRLLTILILPLMSCAARLPVYTLFAGALFQEHQGLVVFSLYFMGIVLAVLVATVFRKLIFKEESAPLVMELPPYRMPSFKNVFLHMWLRSWLFIQKAGTMIFLTVILVWGLASFPLGVPYASEQTLIGRLGKAIAPVFAPAGFDFWQAGVALISGIFAKEAVIGTLGTLFGVGERGLTSVLQQYFTPLSGYAFLVMILVYIPCVPTIVTIKSETNGKWAAFAVVYTLLLGWVLSVLVYQGGRFLGA